MDKRNYISDFSVESNFELCVLLRELHCFTCIGYSADYCCQQQFTMHKICLLCHTENFIGEIDCLEDIYVIKFLQKNK